MHTIMTILIAFLMTAVSCAELNLIQQPLDEQSAMYDSMELERKRYEDFFALTEDVHNKDVYRLKVLYDVKDTHGEKAFERLQDWYTLIDDNKNIAEKDKIEKVNKFFNRFNWKSDSANWESEDYWANPVEMIISDGGDCEDFALAKYFTLLELGVAADKLRMTVTTTRENREPHMVLAYYKNPTADPLIMDNLVRKVKKASLRNDINPVYSFNEALASVMTGSNWQNYKLECWCE